MGYVLAKINIIGMEVHVHHVFQNAKTAKTKLHSAQIAKQVYSWMMQINVFVNQEHFKAHQHSLMIVSHAQRIVIIVQALLMIVHSVIKILFWIQLLKNVSAQLAFLRLIMNAFNVHGLVFNALHYLVANYAIKLNMLQPSTNNVFVKMDII